METNAIIKQLKDLLYGPLWLDENFKKKIEPLAEDQAFEKPLLALHSVAELVSHITVWINACVDRMSHIANTLHDNDANDWKTNEQLKQMGWDTLKSEFYAAHDRLIDLIKANDEDFLSQKYMQTEFSIKDILHGLIHHDAYHLGQIGITIKMLKKDQA